MKGFTQLSLAALAAYVSATAINVNKRESPLGVTLEAAGNSEVKVAVTNNGASTINLLSKGTFLDEVNPVQKVKMFSSGGSKSRLSLCSQIDRTCTISLS
jgi:deuterolysin